MLSKHPCTECTTVQNVQLYRMYNCTECYFFHESMKRAKWRKRVEKYKEKTKNPPRFSPQIKNRFTKKKMFLQFSTLPPFPQVAPQSRLLSRMYVNINPSKIMDQTHCNGLGLIRGLRPLQPHYSSTVYSTPASLQLYSLQYSR